ncbi:CDP-diacylglycerol pyrophosphatase [Roseiarcus fermentans]|uniref:CDP-diacylglycerol pyrophosphatase n=1 Tax=Roseiarcus fermentans TaxID=1473586 RepID=A0A366FLV1_9HYPH|nr:CDP-diacylglycerol diphosphatase [Roseiarcus fermentans]RBP15632.1 CDP-diacylglycerol pyrophosphatase [Roseiarcus fermentans]
MLRALRRLTTAALLIAAGAAEAADRNRLWPVVRTCVSAYRLLGVSFPCLKVELPGGDPNLGVAVLRPLRRDDLILSPTRQTVGIEDPFLQSDKAPNYFAAAWRARAFLKGPDGEPPPRDDVVLVVNARSARSQDQLHIHIGCLPPEARRFLAEAARTMPLGVWTRVGAVLPHEVYFGERVREAEFARLNPFRLAAQGFAGAADHPDRLMVMTVGARVRGEDDFLILAFFEGVRGELRHSGAEALLDRRCTAPSPLG